MWRLRTSVREVEIRPVVLLADGRLGRSGVTLIRLGHGRPLDQSNLACKRTTEDVTVLVFISATVVFEFR
jgi:hypothetical protein